MHELSLCQALIEQVEKVAADHRANAVAVIVLRIGPLAGVEPELLKQAFTIACSGTIADGAELRIAHERVRVRCKTCGAESEALPNRLPCGVCGDWRTTVVGGDALLLERVELVCEENLCATPAAAM
jgi:hydrogenase nickel incorporation protein HypA/HybF